MNEKQFIGEETNSDEQNKYTLLESLVEIAPLIKEISPVDCMIGVTDTEKFLRYLPCEDLDLKAEGEPVPEGDAIYEAIKTNRAQNIVVPEEAFGVGSSFKATGVPIRDGTGKVIGGLGLGVSLRNQEKLNNAIQSFSSTSEEVVATTEELASSAQELSEEMQKLSNLQQEMIEQVRKTENILDIINKVAKNSNLLGLNASIEAARAGEYGKGFTVVAEEIQKMADESSTSVNEVKEILNSIHEKAEKVNDTISKVSDVAQQQASGTQEISASMQELATFAKEVEEVGKIM